MPRKYYICPDNIQIKVSDCINEGGCRMDDRCVSWGLLRAISKQREYDPKNYKPSTTELISGTRYTYLRLTRDYAERPDDLVQMLLGTAMHQNIEQRSDGEQSIIEERLEKDGITGQGDIYEVENSVTALTDYKSSGSYKVAQALGMQKDMRDDPNGEVYKRDSKYGKKGEIKQVPYFWIDLEKQNCKDWIMQLNHYRILYEHAGFPVNKLQIQCIVRDGGIITAQSRGIDKKSYIIPIPIMNDSEVEKYFYFKRIALQYALQRKHMPVRCNKEERWDDRRCEKYCPVNVFCPYYEQLITERRDHA